MTKDRDETKGETNAQERTLNRRSILLGGTTLAAASALIAGAPLQTAQAQPASAPSTARKPNIFEPCGGDLSPVKRP